MRCLLTINNGEPLKDFERECAQVQLWDKREPKLCVEHIEGELLSGANTVGHTVSGLRDI